MTIWSRRQVLGVATLAGGAICGAGAYQTWRVLGGVAPRLRDPVADLERWRRLDAGRPILVAVPPAGRSPFGACLSEVLLSEGVNAFSLAPLDEAIRYGLESFAVVVVAAGEPDAHHVQALERYVAQGGRLIAMRPSDALAARLGVDVVGSHTTGVGVVGVEDHAWTSARVTRRARVFAPATAYRADGAEAIATLTRPAGGPSFPCVVRPRRLNGRIVVWGFDVAEATVLARQGNPALADRSADTRAYDLFAGWIDPSTLDVPHADEHARLLVDVLAGLLEEVCPLPRAWYFGGEAPGLLVATGDAHQSPAWAIDDVLERVERQGGTMSVYFGPPMTFGLRRVYRSARHRLRDVSVARGIASSTEMIPRIGDVSRWRARGHEFGVHVDVDHGWDAGWDAAWRAFDAFGYGPASPTMRTHRVRWRGWATAAVWQAERGIRMNTDYYHHGESFRDGEGTWRYGFFTGSGLPARFVDERGRVLDIVQQCTHLVDEHLMPAPWGGSGPGLGPTEAAEVSREVLALGTRPESPAAVGAQFHVDPFAMGDEWRAPFGSWLDATLAEAASRGVPIVSAERSLADVDARVGTTFDAVRWDEATSRLTFRATVPSGSNRLPTLRLPGRFRGRACAAVRFGGATAWERRTTADDPRGVLVPLRHPSEDVEVFYPS